MAPLKKRIELSLLATIISITFLSCAHDFKKLQFKDTDDVVAQVLRVKIHGNDVNERFTVYTQVNRTQRKAILDGVGTAGKHIFTLSSDGKKYDLIDHINDTQSSGDIKDLELIALDGDLLFKQLDINSAQPIIVKGKDKDTTIEIRIKEQRRL